jgi:V8-like Glu-specific endopeptidase
MTAITVVSVGFGLACGISAMADVGFSGIGQPSAAVTYDVSAAAQRATVAFWTQGRMTDAAGDSDPAVTTEYPGVSASAVPAATPPKGTPTGVEFSGVKTVGALFYTTGSKNHYCTASVVDSAHGDLLITAAHCVYHTSFAANIAYVPDYHSGTRPYGAWTITSIIISSRWRSAHDPNYDVAFLAVAPHGKSQIQAVTGGLALELNGGYNRDIEVIGYNDAQSEPTRCATRSFEFRTDQQEFYCYNFRNGTSGGPWIFGYNSNTGTGHVDGVIGGFEEGGTLDWASYSPYFTSAIGALFQQAEADA